MTCSRKFSVGAVIRAVRSLVPKFSRKYSAKRRNSGCSVGSPPMMPTTPGNSFSELTARLKVSKSMKNGLTWWPQKRVQFEHR